MLLDEFQKQKRCALVAYLVAGHPSLAETEAHVDALVASGVDVLELGVPFSDAMADGPVIQGASEAAAARGLSLETTLELSATLRRKHPKLGIVLFTYFNPLLKAGLADFARRASKNGVNAVLAVDLPPEEAGSYRVALRDAGVGTVFLASPTTESARLPLIEEASTEFIYYVSRAGVTGVRSRNSDSLASELLRLRQLVAKPIAVGFGISTAEQAAEVAALADGVVVGSAFVRAISESASAADAAKKLTALAGGLRRGIETAKRSPIARKD